MSTPPVSVTPVTLSEEQKLSFLLEATGDLDTAQALQKNLPAALLNATADTLAALDKAARDLQAIQSTVETHLGRLQPLNSFCIDLLNRTLSARWSAVFDVEKDHLQLPGSYCGCEPVVPPGGGPAVIPFATPTLLEAAMQNFTEDEAQPDYFPEGSVVRITSMPEGVPGLTPTAFAAFCRELNLGQQYQQHFQQVFGVKTVDGNRTATGPLVLDITTMKKHLLQLDLLLALVREHVSQEGFQTVQRLIDAGGVVDTQSLRFQGRPLIMQGIELLESCIWGVVVFSERSVESDPDQWCLVYMPGEPDQPLYEYASFTAFTTYLEFKLGVDSYKSYFTHCIGEGDKIDFFKTFADTGSLGRVRQLEMPGPLFDFMFKSHVGKLQLDARVLAVPTEDVDEEARRTRLLHYLETGMTVANAAGFVLPVLGQLMMGVAIGQMLAEIYEGIEDWSQGDRQEAFSHLLSVAENIVLMAVVGAGVKGLKSLAIRTVRKHPDFFHAFTAILDNKGQPRLWKPQLDGYEQPLPVGADPDPEVTGLYRGEGRFFARIDHHFYEVVLEPASDTWRIRHPVRPDAYAPPLKPHRHGGWRHPGEASEQWNGAYTLRRIDPNLGRFEDSRLEMIRRLTDTRFDELHRLSDDNLSLPPRLRDMIERFGIERRLRDFVRAMERGEATDARHVQEQLHVLPELANWPADRYIKVVDESDRITATYPPASIDDDTVSIIVSHEQLEKGELLQTVLDGMYPWEVEALVGANVAPADASVQLAKVIGAAVKADCRSVFDHLYQQFDRGVFGESVRLRSAFPGLPRRYARELLRRTPSVERTRLRRTGRVPMGLAQRARQALSDVRVDRALAGFYLADIASADTRTLAIRLLPRLSGWDPEFYLELRAKTLNGDVLETLGEKPLAISSSCTLVELDNGYEVFGRDRKSLGKVVSGPEDLYHAILKGLSKEQRKAIGFALPKPEDGARLRSMLLEGALDEREGCARVLAGGQLQAAIAEPVCISADSPVGSKTHSRRLLRQVKKLYPLFSDVQANEFLDQSGSDHLSRAIRVRQLREDLSRLREVMDTWVEDEAAMKALGGDLNEIHECRQIVAFEIEDCFRRLIFLPDEAGRLVYGLKLDGMRFGKFPTLPVGLTFDHVRQLSMQDMLLDNDAVYFLKAFTKIESLELDRNQITRLPEIISHMPNLKRLSLADNRIQLTEHSLVTLARLRTLQSLNLSGNFLGATVDVGNLFDLTYLSLRNTRATEFPKGLQLLPNLDRVDLRDNEIRDLPAWLFETPRRFSETINLRHNPISDVSRTYLYDYRRTVGIGMGYLDNDIARLDENQARSIWLTETGGEEGSRHLQMWNAIKDDPRAEGLFALLAELGNSAESANVREDMYRRVWTVLDATQSDAELREQIFDLAANPINCTDNAALNFSHLEVAVQVHHVTRASKGQRPSTKALLKLARGLFRLEQIDRIAAQHAQAQAAPDPLEVTLAYRSGLAQALELPGQPSHMRYASLAKVTGADLVEAINRIQTAELSPEWLAFLVRQPFWVEYVKSSFARQFDDARALHQEQALALFEKAEELSSADYLSEMNLCAARQEQTESALLEQLTEQVLRRVEGNICLLSGG
ncbi:NEL-type E3 ubiquitin ligase domain-containing protein [Pseudomonas sp. HLG18]|uniref:NEL-type E3 ubiquitin ligase domain-containing protein n=1 Tax=Pseudomonas sp. HLG18 TaxID=3449277 RepID=UPI003F746A44